MNRSLMIPAGCCLVAFAAVLATFRGAASRETGPQGQRQSQPDAARNGDALSLLPPDEAKRTLQSLSEEYLRPWQQWENSPSRLYSRVAPRPVPSISAEIELSQGLTGESDHFLLATIAIRKGKQSQAVPCVVDRITKRVRFFSDGQWLAENEWLKKAPLPQ